MPLSDCWLIWEPNVSSYIGSDWAKWVCYHHTQELLSLWKLIPDNTYLCVRLVVCSHYLVKCVSITCFPYWGLDHLHALSPHLGDNGGDVHYILLDSLLQSHVNGNQCACPPHTSTAGWDTWPVNLVLSSHPPSTLQEERGIWCIIIQHFCRSAEFRQDNLIGWCSIYLTCTRLTYCKPLSFTHRTFTDLLARPPTQ